MAAVSVKQRLPGKGEKRAVLTDYMKVRKMLGVGMIGGDLWVV